MRLERVAGRKKQPLRLWVRVLLGYLAGVGVLMPASVVCSIAVGAVTALVMLVLGAGAALGAKEDTLMGTSWILGTLPMFVAFIPAGFTVVVVAKHRGALHGILFGLGWALMGVLMPPELPDDKVSSLPSYVLLSPALMATAVFLGSSVGAGLGVWIERRRSQS